MSNEKNSTSFNDWMKQVDGVMGDLIGPGSWLTSSDLADIAYRDLFDSGNTPEDAAEMALDNEGF